MTVAIIGAGPAGCFLGAKISWDKAIIFDKKSNLGCPIQCTGIVTESIYRNMDIPDEIVKNHIDTFRIQSPDGKKIDVALKKKNIIMDRGAFDRHIAELAKKNGTEIKLNHELIGWEILQDFNRQSKTNKKGEFFRLKFANGKTYDVDYIVGADGPYSPVAKIAGLYGNREVLRGYQGRVKIKNESQRFTPNVTDVLFGLGEFAWIVPESETIARIGIIGKGAKQMKAEYEKLVRDYDVLEEQHGSIPMYNPKQVMQQGRIALIGDAATHVKATTYGGIIYGIVAASYIAERWDDYEKRFRAKLGKDLWISLKMREVLNKFSEKECNELVDIFEQGEGNEILGKGDRNFPSKFILKLLMKETRLWKYGFKLFK